MSPEVQLTEIERQVFRLIQCYVFVDFLKFSFLAVFHKWPCGMKRNHCPFDIKCQIKRTMPHSSVHNLDFCQQAETVRKNES